MSEGWDFISLWIYGFMDLFYCLLLVYIAILVVLAYEAIVWSGQIHSIPGALVCYPFLLIVCMDHESVQIQNQCECF